MCDTVWFQRGQTWFGKNSDREPGEAQVVEFHPSQTFGDGQRLHTTYLSIPQTQRTHAVILSRPFWMWGAEMGVNDHGVAIGNEAVFTRAPVAEVGLTGMDLVRLGLERAESAEQALDVMTALLEEHGQGGSSGYRIKSFRYHNTFIVADGREAWILETAGSHWVAKRAEAVATISNVLQIRSDYDRISEGAEAHARIRGWWDGEQPFDWAAAYADPAFRVLTGGELRRACTHAALATPLHPESAELRTALRTHVDEPASGWRSISPCAHASWWPTRHAAQTTGSLIARLGSTPEVWATGTSSPCLSVYKPVRFDEPFHVREPGANWDDESLWWRHERFHRTVLENWSARRHVGAEQRAELERAAFEANAEELGLWEEHRQLVSQWAIEARNTDSPQSGPFGLYWRYQSLKDSVPSR